MPSAPSPCCCCCCCCSIPWCLRRLSSTAMSRTISSTSGPYDVNWDSRRTARWSLCSGRSDGESSSRAMPPTASSRLWSALMCALACSLSSCSVKSASWLSIKSALSMAFWGNLRAVSQPSQQQFRRVVSTSSRQPSKGVPFQVLCPNRSSRSVMARLTITRMMGTFWAASNTNISFCARASARALRSPALTASPPVPPPSITLSLSPPCSSSSSSSASASSAGTPLRPPLALFAPFLPLPVDATRLLPVLTACTGAGTSSLVAAALGASPSALQPSSWACFSCARPAKREACAACTTCPVTSMPMRPWPCAAPQRSSS
mmetsp:Transcript_7541/g.20083  ORF Transcript_7541/g.20083 Transcript_7541/m.20083 type:complete len:319 (+) Transcript_7541:1715-2671(+)